MRNAKDTAEEAALRLLARRDHSRAELRGKLARRGFQPGEREAALDKLELRGYLDDLRYARRLALSLGNDKLLGPEKVLQKLIQRGISPGRSREILKELEEKLPARERLVMALRRKEKTRNPGNMDSTDQAKLGRYLRQRGFSWDDIREVLQAGGSFEE